MKRFAVLLLTLAMAFCCAAPAFAAGTIEVTEDVSVSDDYDWTRFQGQNLTLNVYNWGEGSNRARNWQRYDLGGSTKLSFEEGVDSYVPYAGPLADGVHTVRTAVLCRCVSTDSTDTIRRFSSIRIPSFRPFRAFMDWSRFRPA